jgi:hypothetical protein
VLALEYLQRFTRWLHCRAHSNWIFSALFSCTLTGPSSAARVRYVERASCLGLACHANMDLLMPNLHRIAGPTNDSASSTGDWSPPFCTLAASPSTFCSKSTFCTLCCLGCAVPWFQDKSRGPCDMASALTPSNTTHSVRHARMSEESSFQGKSLDFLYFLSLGALMVVGLAIATSARVAFLSSSLNFMLIYVW